MLLDSGLKC